MTRSLSQQKSVVLQSAFLRCDYPLNVGQRDQAEILGPDFVAKNSACTSPAGQIKYVQTVMEDLVMTKHKLYIMSLVPMGIALNIVLGTLVQTIKLPIYLDAVGTIAVTLLVSSAGRTGMIAGIAVGVLSFLIGGALFNPVLPWFSGTQAVVAIYTYLVIARIVNLENNVPARWLWWKLIPAGIGLGIVSGIASAPVIVAVFGGITGSGASLVAAFILKSGDTLINSVIYSGLASEPLDKTLQVLLAVAIYRATPIRHRRSFAVN